MHKDEYDEDEFPEEGEEESPSPERPRYRWAWRLLHLVIVLALLWFIGLCLFIDSYGQWDQAQHAQVIVILGARVEPGGQAGDSLRARTLQAVALYKRGLAQKIICTGGLGDNPPTEAIVAATLAEQQGVAPGDLFLETKSTSTWENARFAADICRKQRWTHAIVVSDPYHLWRVQRDFSAQGLTVYTSPARNCERNRKILMRLQWTAREGLAVTRDFLLGAGRWIKGKTVR